MGASFDGNKWRRTVKPHTTVTLVLTTTLLLLNSATAQEIINNKPTPSRAPNGRRSAKRMGGTIRLPT